MLYLHAAGRSAWAEENPAGEAAARELYARGSRHYEAGRFLDAAHAFESAYEASRRYPLLWDIARAYRRQYEIDRDPTNLRRAREVFRHYRELAGKPSERTDGELAAKECDRLLARSTPSLNSDGAAKRVDDRRAAKIVAWSLLGGGAAIALAGLGMGLGAHAAANSVENAAAAGNSYDQIRSDESRGQLLTTLSYVAYGVGAAAMIAGVVVALVRLRAHPTSTLSALSTTMEGVRF